MLLFGIILSIASLMSGKRNSGMLTVLLSASVLGVVPALILFASFLSFDSVIAVLILIVLFI